MNPVAPVFYLASMALAVVSMVAALVESRNPTGREGVAAYAVPLVFSAVFLIAGWVIA